MQPITKEELQHQRTEGHLEQELLELRRRALFEARNLRATKIQVRLPDNYLASEEARLLERACAMFVGCNVHLHTDKTEGYTRYIVIDWS